MINDYDMIRYDAQSRHRNVILYYEFLVELLGSVFVV